MFKGIIDTIPAPQTQTDSGFQLQATTLEHDSHKGNLVIGKVLRGQAKLNDQLALVRNQKIVSQEKISYLFSFNGLKKEAITETQIGDIVAIAGFSGVKIGDTLTSPDKPESLPPLEISEPTIQVQITPSNSPLVGQDGSLVNSRQIQQRLHRELETNVSLRLSKGTSSEALVVSGRGELHLSILIETMRREGYEFSVSRPEVIIKPVDGKPHEPWEDLTIEVPEKFTGVIIDSLGKRKAEMTNMQNLATGVRINYKISTRNSLGLRSDLLTLTSGMAVIHSQLTGYQPLGDVFDKKRSGSLVATEPGQALAYAIYKLQQRATTFVAAGSQVYTGMIVGQNSRAEDLWVNICKGKQLTNMRAASADSSVSIAPPVHMSLEQCLNFLGPDELLEVTPKHLRLRKKSLSKK